MGERWVKDGLVGESIGVEVTEWRGGGGWQGAGVRGTEEGGGGWVGAAWRKGQVVSAGCFGRERGRVWHQIRGVARSDFRPTTVPVAGCTIYSITQFFTLAKCTD